MNAAEAAVQAPARPGQRVAQRSSPVPVRTWRPHRWLPTALIIVPTVAAVHHYSVSWRDLAAFGAYILLGLLLPGVLLWRAARRRSGSLAEDWAPGLAVGYALEVPAYLIVRAAGAPLLVLVAPIAVVVLFAAVRPWRRYWRADADAARPPTGWLWAMAGLVGTIMVLTCVGYLRTRGPLYGFGDADQPFHLALIGEARHHVPPTVPWVAGESLDYHWFGYLHLAASSWVTGIEPETLLLRLYYFPLLAGLPVALAVAAHRLTRRWWPGPVAAAIVFFGVAPDPYSWPFAAAYQFRGYGAVDDGGLLRDSLWVSVTQTYAALLCVPLVIVLVDVLRGRVAGRRTWVLLAVLVAVMTGAKATYLPILLCGLAVVVVLTWVAERRLHRRAVACAGLVLLGLGFAQVVLLGGASHGMVLDPLGSVQFTSLGVTTELHRQPLTVAATAELTLVTLAAWTAVWCGAAGLLVRRRWVDPAYGLLVGVGVAGLGGVLAFRHYAHSETWFLVAARPYLALAAAGGLAALLPAGRVAHRRRFLAVAAVVAVAAGAGFAWFVSTIGPDEAPTAGADGQQAVLLGVAWPYLALAGAAVVAGFGLWAAARRVAVLRGLAAALVVITVTAMGAPAAAAFAGRTVGAAVEDRFRAVDRQQTSMAPGTRRAARWLRDHSATGDLVATNAHCRRHNGCDNLRFWFSAFAERRFLVEGWGFTSRSNGMTGARSPVFAPYWDSGRLAANDAVFRTPDAANVDRLRRGYGVRWLLVDETATRVSADLGRHATLRFRAGRCAVYEL